MRVLVLIVGSPNFTSALTIENITSNKGPVAGGNEVTITGSGFTTTLQVQDEIIDIVGATEINPHSDNQYGTVLVLTKAESCTHTAVAYMAALALELVAIAQYRHHWILRALLRSSLLLH